MAISKQQKDEILQKLVDKFGKSKSVVFAEYRGLDVASLSDLRGRLRKGDAEMQVAKKTLMRIAGEKNNVTLDKSMMEGPVAATFSYEDAMSGIKILFNFAKENDKLKLLGGVIDGKVVGPEIIQEYAKLPGREELLAKLLGSMNSPVSGTVGLLGNLIAGFVRVLNAHKDKMPAEASPEVKEEAKAPEAPVATTQPDLETPAPEAASAPEATPSEEPKADAQATEKA